MKKITFLFVFIYSIHLNGQTLKDGDSTVVERIRNSTSLIYGNSDKTHFFLTSKQFGLVVTYGTSLTVYEKDSSINRVVAISMTPNGQLATEYYLENKQLIYVYQAFEFFSEKEVTGNWKNFKGIASWESRYYFIDNELLFQKHIGKKELALDKFINDLHQQVQQIIEYKTERLISR